MEVAGFTPLMTRRNIHEIIKKSSSFLLKNFNKNERILG
jgi:hypothetical protein